MNGNAANQQKRLYLISVMVLLIGLGSALTIYLTADDGSDDAAGYETIGGYSSPMSPGNSRLYVHDLQLYGGRANVIADEFRIWFIGLWQGKALASTVAVITVALAFGLAFIAYHTPPAVPPDLHSDNRR